MPSVEQLRSRLLKKLSELFQLDQPDLDFGFYRIMHAKAQEVQNFIGTDLLKIVADAFGDVDEARKAELQAAYEKAIQTAKDFGAPSPEETEPVKKAKAALDAVKDTASAEADVYDHLYRFFERYYDDGDFISRRYYTRETSGKAAPFAVPYNGEEVKLHWANADQYYIKSAEYFSNFTFDLRKAKEVQATKGSLPVEWDETPLLVHFRVIDATEGEHGNIKTSEANKRFFILHAKNPIALTETSELVINFEYRPDPKKTGQENTWRDKRNAEAVEIILDRLQAMAAAGGEHKKQVVEYLSLFKVPAPTASDKKRPVLAKYLNQYTARNTMDYFIHNGLDGFLSRELDFYIKNEVMRLDDIENAEAPAVESYLAKIKVLRKIAGKLIDFLAQLEDFQKKLWLKRKMVIETHFCISLDRIPEEHYPAVAANDEQRRAWVSLFSIDNIEDYSDPLSISFLKKNRKLPVDTSLFPNDFEEKLLAAQEDLDGGLTGVMMHSDNFHALNLATRRFAETFKSIYIDPPYNTDSSSIPYKNNYKHSSFAALMRDRLGACYPLLRKDGALFVSIDKTERTVLEHVLDEVFGDENHIEELIWTQATSNSQLPNYSTNHEYVEVYVKDRTAVEADKGMFREPKPGFSEVMELVRKLNPDYPSTANIEREIKGLYQRHKHEYQDELEATGKEWDAEAKRQDPWRGLYPYNRVEYRDSDGKFVPEEEAEAKAAQIWVWSEIPTSAPASKQSPTTKDQNHSNYRYYKPIHPITKKPCPHPQSGWKFPEKPDPNNEDRRSFESLQADNRIAWGEDEKKVPRTKGFLHEVETNIGTSVFYEYNDGEAELGSMFGGSGLFLSPKSSKFVKKFILQSTKPDSWFADFFGGSGSSAHAVIQANREDGGARKFLLVEMGHYFDWLTKPRVLKALYASDWKSGMPRSKDGVSALLKIVRLESYEDTLNNLRLDHNPQRNNAVEANPSLKEDYMLRYLLDVETRGSQSLLNIDAFADPRRYTLDVKKPGTDEYATRAVDLIETFNYLIGLRVLHSSVSQSFRATFKRITDTELPEDQHTKLVVDGRIRQDESGPWWFRKVEGWVPKDPANPNNGQREKVLIVWRKLTDDIEQDNLMLDEWFQKNRISTRDFEFDTIYVNGSNNLPNLRLDDENWKVRLIEEEFMKRMWDVAGA
jgi:adenine-specific DNA-methyltransferase